MYTNKYIYFFSSQIPGQTWVVQNLPAIDLGDFSIQLHFRTFIIKHDLALIKVLKFGCSEKATKFSPIFHLCISYNLTLLSNVK